ncbi:MAG: ABC transporter permease [Vicinamibacterales bacterium]
MSRVLLWLASRLVPADRRREWLEQWRAEVWALEHPGTPTAPRRATLRFVAGAVPDALVEAVHGWREGWSFAGLAADVRDTWRAARRTPATTLLSVGIMAVGAAATATIFSLADAVLFRPPPGLEDPARLVQIGRKDAASFDNFSYPNYQDLRDGLADVLDLAGWANTRVVAGDGLDAEELPAQAVTAGFFRVTGVALTGGPGLVGADELAFDGRAEAVVSAAFWRAHDAEIVANGGHVRLNGRSFRVVGVTPDGFIGVDAGIPAPAVWLPLLAVGAGDARERLTERGWSWLQIVGRVRPDVSMSAARDATLAVHARLAERFAPTIGDTVTFVEGVGLAPPDRALADRLLGVFMAVALLVLVVAAANVTGLQFSRHVARRHELAVRRALGASRRRVLRALFVEQALLAAAGGSLAFLVTYWTTGWLRLALPYEVAIAFGPTARLLAFAVGASVSASTAVGLWPLLRVIGQGGHEALRARRPASGRLRVGRVLVGLELAIAALVLTLAGLLVRSALQATRVAPGFDVSHTLVVSLRRQPNRTTPSSVVMEAAERRLRGVPGVTAVGVATSVPVADPQSSRVLLPPGAEYDPNARRMPVIAAGADPGFFEVLGLDAIEGRVLDAGDRIGVEVPAVVNEAFARRMFPGARAAGQVLSSGPATYRIVGVVTQTALRSLRDRELPAMWTPLDDRGEFPSRLLVRTTAPPAASTAAVRAALAPLADDILVRRIEPLAPLVTASVGDTLLAARLTMVFGLGTLMMAVVGLYGLSSAQVSARRYEIGVRLALGAAPNAVTRGVMAAAARTALVGSGAGVAAGCLAGPPLQALLFDTDPVDPLVMAATTLLLSLAAIIAAAGPARRAGRTDPLVVMRTD